MLSFEKRGVLGVEMSLYTLNTDEEIVFIQFNANGTVGYSEDDYMIIKFLDLDITVETSSLSTKKRIIKELFKQKVINENGVIDEEKAKRFASKYDENITARTIRY